MNESPASGAVPAVREAGGPRESLSHAQDFNAFQQAALDCQPALAEFRRIASAAGRVSLNAEIGAARLGSQGAAYGIIAKEIAEIVRQLSALLVDLEAAFRTIALHAVGSMRGEQRFLKLADARERMHRAGPDAEWHGAEPSLLQAQLAELMRQEQGEVRVARRKALELTRKLALFVNRISRVAGRQSHFAAITAAVESSRVAGQGDLTSVTALFRQLADDIAQTERKARDPILSLMGRADSLRRVLQ